MSFSSEVKTELAAILNLQCCQKAELSALFHIGGAIEITSLGLAITFQTTNNAVMRKFVRLLKELYRIEVTLIDKKQTNLRKDDLYFARVSDKVETLLQDLSLMNKSASFFQDVDERLIRKECCKKAYLRGAFLAGGSINSPDTASYHLEIQTFSERQAEVIQKLGETFDLNVKIAANKRGFIAYMKEAERIADFLRVSGATNQLFAFEDSRIKRDFKNSINRVINCDIANEKKALDAAKVQLEHIAVVEAHMGERLSKSIKEAIFLRKTYPEATLIELQYVSKEHYPESITKSALNHRFRAIRDLAATIATESEEFHD